MFSKMIRFLTIVGGGARISCEVFGLGLEGTVEAWDLSVDDEDLLLIASSGTLALTKMTELVWLQAMQVRERQLWTSMDVDGALIFI